MQGQLLKFAAIDIGSNAVRLLFANVVADGAQPVVQKESLLRVPLRLGTEVFAHGRLSEEKADDLVKTMIAFKYLLETQRPLAYRACATSAMREAANGPEICARIEAETGIAVEIIAGKREAEVIYSNHVAENLEAGTSYLYIDVGGGSTELTLFAENRVVASASFDIGTVRLLGDLVSATAWQALKGWVKTLAAGHRPLAAIGTGGNINKYFSLAEQREGKPLSYKKLRALYTWLKSHSLAERIAQLRLKPDRADVIIPAGRIYLAIMKWAGIPEIHVPQVGLSDGMIHILYDEYRRRINN
ncbi:MAG: Guanosine-5'-triphosphate,3'-diphosphate pyrophosphatase [bacterium]|nr:Guanosine-5'-triphosphate,3'-diphosphate pyrophosphatase [bacterium]